MRKQESTILEHLLKSCPTIEIDGKLYLRADQFRGYVHNFQEAIRHGDASMLFEKRGLRVAKIVDMEEFVCAKDYLGLRRAVRPAVLEHLIKCFDSENYYLEVLLAGATGTGKGYFANCGLARCLYYLGCLHNPQMEYALSPGSSIYFIIQSKSATLARKAVFDEFRGFINNSPWFQKHFPYDRSVLSELRFPHNVYVTPFGGKDDQAIGLNVLGGILDELNFMLRTRDSVAIQYTGEEEFDQAERVYNTINRRMMGRFHSHGRVPGKLFLVSSPAYPGDFTDRKEQEAATEAGKHIYVMKLAQWESIPADRFSKERFKVAVGNENNRSRILEPHEAPPPDVQVIEIPEDYRTLYEKDIDGALRDTAGITTATDAPFIPYREELTQCMEDFKAITDGRSLFYQEEISLQALFRGTDKPDFSEIVNMEYLEDIKGTTGALALHHDVGSSNDASGIGLSRIAGYKLLPPTRYFSTKKDTWVDVTDMRSPIYRVEGAVGIREKRGQEIQVAHVLALVTFLHEHLGIKWATADWYQSIAFLQHCKSIGIRSGTISVDATLMPYAEVKESIRELRFQACGSILKKQLLSLQLTDDGKKVDHPQNGAKDVADGVAGSIHMLHIKEASYRQPHEGSRRRGGYKPNERTTQRIDRLENPRGYGRRRLKQGRVLKLG